MKPSIPALRLLGLACASILLNASGNAGANTAPGNAATPPRCEINQTKNFAGSCSASIKDSLPSGSNRSYDNTRAGYVGAVNANCIDGKVHWSTGLCRPATAKAAAALTESAMTRPAGSDYKIGTFYFPGWRDNQPGAPAKQPWARLKAFPEREPMLGWYDDGDVATMEQQLKWMRSYGIDYLMFDWYWNGKAAALTHSVEAYLKTETKKDVPFALLWANHTGVPRTKLEFTSMVDYWIKNYFDRPEFMKIDGKPVIFVFSHPDFVKQAGQVGESYTALLNEAEALARKAGHKGIYFIGGTHVDFSVFKIASTSGYSAFSAYNYQGQGNDTSISFKELDSAYQNIWDVIVKNSSIPYIVPMTQGWDKRPWGGSRNPLHDRSAGALPEFEQHLIAAKNLMDSQPGKTLKMGVICCWNEFGEGSFIEPTKKDGFSYLEKVKRIFGAP